jgi:broad specificity phosphatase PhoE
MMVEPSEVTDMDLYLMQHGQATTETEDPERPLTDAGRAAVQRVAHWCTICVSVILDGSPMHPRCRRVTAIVA